METATLPYELNTISFGSYNAMFNFLYWENRLSRQQADAITQLVLPDGLPGPTILDHLQGLKKVFLGVELANLRKGWYHVVREEGKHPRLVSK